MTEKNKERLEFARSIKNEYPLDKFGICQIDSSARIGDYGFGWVRNEIGELESMPHQGNVVIEDNVEVKSFVTIDRAVVGSTIINKGTKIDHHCHIAHGVKIGVWNTFAAHCIIEGSCEIGDYNTFGTGVIIQKKVKVGSHCIIGSGSVITKDVPDYSVMVGNPARLIHKNDED